MPLFVGIVDIDPLATDDFVGAKSEGGDAECVAALLRLAQVSERGET
jgi:hypothetical protein